MDKKITVKLDGSTPVYFIDEKDIKEIVNKQNPTRKVGALDIPSLEKKINAMPAVDSANVYLNLNGNLNLDIRQKIPVFRLNNNGKDFYVDGKGREFPISTRFSYPCMLVMGNVEKNEYPKLVELVNKIDKDDFSKKYFIGISKEKNNYNLLTSEGNYKVEIGDLDNIEFKVKGFKTFVEKFLVYQDPEKYTKVSLKYDNQIVTTLNPHFKENDSILLIGKKELDKLPTTEKKTTTSTPVVASTKPKTTEKKATTTKPKETTKPKTVEKPKEKPKTDKAKTTASKTEKPKEKKKTQSTKPKSN